MAFEGEKVPMSPSELLNQRIDDLAAKLAEVRDLKKKYDDMSEDNPHKKKWVMQSKVF